MPETVTATNDPLYRKYVHEVSRRGGMPASYAQFCQQLRGPSDFDFASLLLPPVPVQPSPAPPVASPKFPLGQLCLTPGAAAAISADEVCAALRRHVQGDWGDLDAHDIAENERALQHGGRLFSAYTTGNGVKFWIITEAGHAATTLLLPEEY